MMLVEEVMKPVLMGRKANYQKNGEPDDYRRQIIQIFCLVDDFMKSVTKHTQAKLYLQRIGDQRTLSVSASNCADCSMARERSWHETGPP